MSNPYDYCDDPACACKIQKSLEDTWDYLDGKDQRIAHLEAQNALLLDIKDAALAYLDGHGKPELMALGSALWALYDLTKEAKNDADTGV